MTNKDFQIFNELEATQILNRFFRCNDIINVKCFKNGNINYTCEGEKRIIKKDQEALNLFNNELKIRKQINSYLSIEIQEIRNNPNLGTCLEFNSTYEKLITKFKNNNLEMGTSFFDDYKIAFENLEANNNDVFVKGDYNGFYATVLI